MATAKSNEDRQASKLEQIADTLSKIQKLKDSAIALDEKQLEQLNEQQEILALLRKEYKGLRESERDSLSGIQKQNDGLSSMLATMAALPKETGAFRERMLDTVSISKEISDSIKEIPGVFQKTETGKFVSAFDDASKSIAELSNLSKEDQYAITAKNAEIQKSISLMQEEIDAITLSNDADREKLDLLVKAKTELQGSLVEANKFAAMSEESKEVYGELYKDLEGTNKVFKKIAGTIEIFFSSGKNMVGMLLIGAGEIADEFGKIGKEIGVGITEMGTFKAQASLVGAILGDEATEAVIDMGRELGNVNEMTYGMAIDAGTLAANYGLSGEQAAYMATIFGHISGNSDEVGNNTREMVKQLSLVNGIMPADAFKDIAENSEFVATYTKGTGANIGQAAVAAAKLGVNLGTASKMTDHLLDYQSSVQDEMEASVLAGREINLSKARELAYNGDIEGSLKAALEATGGIHEFNKMDPYARQATAKALGVSVGELQKMAAHQQDLNGMNGVGNQVYSRGSELLQAMGNTLTGKMLKGFGGLILGAGQMNIALKSMGTSIGGVVKGTFQIIKNLFAMITPTRILNGMKAFGGAIANSGVGKKVSGFVGGLKDKIMKGVSGGGVTNVADKTEGIADKIQKKGGDGADFKKKAKNISDGVKSFADGKVFLGALGLTATALGLVAILAGIPGMVAIAIGGAATAKGLKALGKGFASFGETMETNAEFVVIGIAALAGIGWSFGIFAEAMSKLAPIVTAIGDVIIGMVKVIVDGIPAIISSIGAFITTVLPAFTLQAAGGILAMAGAFAALAVSLALVGTMGLMALPVLAAVGLVAGAAGMVFGGGGGKDKQDEMIALLQSIDSKVGGAPAIQMDSKLVTTASNNSSARRGDSGGTKH